MCDVIISDNWPLCIFYEIINCLWSKDSQQLSFCHKPMFVCVCWWGASVCKCVGLLHRAWQRSPSLKEKETGKSTQLLHWFYHRYLRVNLQKFLFVYRRGIFNLQWFNLRLSLWSLLTLRMYFMNLTLSWKQKFGKEGHWEYYSK